MDLTLATHAGPFPRCRTAGVSATAEGGATKALRSVPRPVQHRPSPARRPSTTAREAGTPWRLVWCKALLCGLVKQALTDGGGGPGRTAPALSAGGGRGASLETDRASAYQSGRTAPTRGSYRTDRSHVPETPRCRSCPSCVPSQRAPVRGRWIQVPRCTWNTQRESEPPHTRCLSVAWRAIGCLACL